MGRELAGWLLLSIGVLLAGATSYIAAKILRSFGWRQVRATIERHEVRQIGEADPRYGTDLAYTYEFDGETYRSTQFSLIVSQSDRRSDAEIKVERYRAGDEVTAYVNPANPEEAIIERNVLMSLWLVIGASIAFLAVGGWVVFG